MQSLCKSKMNINYRFLFSWNTNEMHCISIETILLIEVLLYLFLHSFLKRIIMLQTAAYMASPVVSLICTFGIQVGKVRKSVNQKDYHFA